MLRHLAALATARGASTLAVHWRKSERNEPAAAFFFSLQGVWFVPCAPDELGLEAIPWRDDGETTGDDGEDAAGTAAAAERSAAAEEEEAAEQAAELQEVATAVTAAATAAAAAAAATAAVAVRCAHGSPLAVGDLPRAEVTGLLLPLPLPLALSPDPNPNPDSDPNPNPNPDPKPSPSPNPNQVMGLLPQAERRVLCKRLAAEVAKARNAAPPCLAPPCPATPRHACEHRHHTTLYTPAPTLTRRTPEPY